MKKKILFSLFVLSSFSLHGRELEKLEAYLWNKQAKYKTSAAVLIKDRKVIYEKYAPHFSPNQRHILWSVSKSITNLIIGRAVKLGYIKRDELVSKSITGLNRESAKYLTVEHLLKMSSGLSFIEGYEDEILKSDTIRMLYGRGRLDMSHYMATRDYLFRPGEHYNYNTGETNLLMGLLKAKLSEDQYLEFPFKDFFGQLEISDVTIERDSAGTWMGGSYVYMRARDLAKIGQFMIDNGQYKGKQILDKSWIKEATTLSPAFVKTAKRKPKEFDIGHGEHWWVNTPYNEKTPHPKAPKDIFLGLGHHGQLLVGFPSLNMVFVRFGLDNRQRIDRDKLINIILEVAEQVNE